ncbi:MAG: hypothetical protein DHS80DRAFT_25144 [Piptocephalis tieghemiana]|nr:MAG: hypothetical protein DHS80DRAFT_25144 [Piptocephalis tieghemiana]
MLLSLATSFLALATTLVSAQSINGSNTTPMNPREAARLFLNDDGVLAQIDFVPVAKGLDITVNVTAGLSPGGQYAYHLHEVGVYDRNCSRAGFHVDPALVNPQDGSYSCNPAKAATTCELGDFSGKHGKLIGGQPLLIQYNEPNLTIPDIQGRSVVIHNLDDSKWICASFPGPPAYPPRAPKPLNHTVDSRDSNPNSPSSSASSFPLLSSSLYLATLATVAITALS